MYFQPLLFVLCGNGRVDGETIRGEVTRCDSAWGGPVQLPRFCGDAAMQEFMLVAGCVTLIAACVKQVTKGWNPTPPSQPGGSSQFGETVIKAGLKILGP